jgi:hypothetical protein
VLQYHGMLVRVFYYTLAKVVNSVAMCDVRAGDLETQKPFFMTGL